MKYLNAFLKGEEISQHAKEEAQLKPRKPVSAVSAGAPGRDTGENGQASTTQPPAYRDLYAEAVEPLSDDCFLIDPYWLIDAHPEQWEQIKALDNRLTTMERTGASEPEYQAVLERLVQCVGDALAAYERDRGQGRERAAVQ